MKFNNHYTTLSVQESAFHRMRGLEYAVKENERGRGVFVFDNSEDLRDSREAFLKGVMVNVQDYIAALRTVKSDLYSFLDNKQEKR